MTMQEEQQYVVVCDDGYGTPSVYGAWDTTQEGAEWLSSNHCTIPDGSSTMCDKSMWPDAHWIVPVIASA